MLMRSLEQSGDEIALLSVRLKGGGRGRSGRQRGNGRERSSLAGG